MTLPKVPSESLQMCLFVAVTMVLHVNEEADLEEETKTVGKYVMPAAIWWHIWEGQKNMPTLT